MGDALNGNISMRTITGTLTPELNSILGNQPVAKTKAIQVSSFIQLMDYVARLSYLNKDYLLFFRGQGFDYTNKAGASTLYPSIYRGDRLSGEELEIRFNILQSASRRLCDALEKEMLPGYKDVKRRRYIQWSILQHYEVCPTPLLDLTHSLRVACSFAFLSANNDAPYVFILGLPYVTNRISINSEHDVVNVRLLSICPPDAKRPYYQEGYLAGTDEITTEYDSKDELDFNNRLIAKFRLDQGSKFWNSGFDVIPGSILYPEMDRVKEICLDIRAELGEMGTEVGPGDLGRFLQEWTDLENIILSMARNYQEKVFSIREAINVLYRKELLPHNLNEQLDRLRRIRNLAVHEPRKMKSQDLVEALQSVIELKNQIRKISL
jgi:hypothetical protein